MDFGWSDGEHHQQSHSAPELESDRAQLRVSLQRQANRSDCGWQGIGRARSADRQIDATRRDDADQRRVNRYSRQQTTLGPAIRDKARRHALSPTRNRARDYKQPASNAFWCRTVAHGQAVHRELLGVSALPEGTFLLEQATSRRYSKI